MFDRENSEIIWVCAGGETEGYGTWEQPYNSIEVALNHVQPGYTVVLKDGTYEGDVTIQVSGTVRQPVRITADDNAVVAIEKGCWFFYDASDCIVSNLVFKNATRGAISVIGMCHRNRFESLSFNQCGSAQNASCTMYFGGCGGENNIVEDCCFEGIDEQQKTQSEGTSIALMISEGDQDDGAPIKNFIIRKNTIRNYGYGILVGGNSATVNLYGHVVEYNTIDNCSVEGILIKCGDTLVRGNRVEHCTKNSISIGAGSSSVLDSNRIVDCKNGARVNGTAHTVVNNCIVRCGDAAVRVCGRSGSDTVEAINLFIENNTFVNCGADETDSLKGTPGIKIEPQTSCVIQKNLIYGQGASFVPADSGALHSNNTDDTPIVPAQYVVRDNITSCANCTCDGVVFKQIEFANEDECFDNSTGYGANGWVLTPRVFDPGIDNPGDDCDYIEACVVDDEEEEFVIPEENEPDNLFAHLYGQIAHGEGFELEEEPQEDDQENYRNY